MSALTLADIKVDLSRLTDAYQSEGCDECVGGGLGRFYPDLYRLTVDDEAWLTDRYWLLPEANCAGYTKAKTFDIIEIPEKYQAPARGWVKALRENPLGPPTAKFAAPFAGEFTRAGLTAFTCGITMKAQTPHALVWDDRVRVGLLMPMREWSDTPEHTTLPVSASALEMFDRLMAADPSMRINKAWDLSVAMSVQS